MKALRNFSLLFVTAFTLCSCDAFASIGAKFDFTQDEYTYQIGTTNELDLHWTGMSLDPDRWGYSYHFEINTANAVCNGSAQDGFTIFATDLGVAKFYVKCDVFKSRTVTINFVNRIVENNGKVNFYDTDGKTLLSTFDLDDNPNIIVPHVSDPNFIGWNDLNTYFPAGSNALTEKRSADYFAMVSNEGSAGLAFNLNNNNDTYTVVGYSGYDYDVKIPSHYNGKLVTEIADKAFENKSITSVYIPSTLINIGSEAFKNSNLAKVDFPLVSMLQSIGSYAFKGCSELEFIVLPLSVGKLGERFAPNTSSSSFYVFLEAPSIDYVSGFNYGPGCHAFYFGIDRYAGFDASHKFEYFIFKDDTAGIYTYDSSSGVQIHINSIDGYPVKAIFMHAFDKTSIEEVYFDENILLIDDCAFYECDTLRVVNFENAANLIEIGDYAFKDCDNLVTVDLSYARNLTTIWNSAFYSCDKLEHVLIPSSVKNIWGKAFGGNPNLTILFEHDSLDEISVYSEWRTWWTGIAGNIDHQCPIYFGIKKFVRHNMTLRYRYAITHENKAILLKYFPFEETDIIIDEIDGYPVSEIGAYAFKGQYLTSITFPETLESIGRQAFENCSDLKFVNIPLNSKLKNISDRAFCECTSLVYIHIPISVKSIGEEAFLNCAKLSILIEGIDTSGIELGENWNKSKNWAGTTFPISTYYGVKSINFENVNNYGGYYYFETHQGYIGLLKWVGVNGAGPTTSLDITSLRGKPFERVCDYAFENLKSINECNEFIYFTIGKDVKVIGKYAFSGLYEGGETYKTSFKVEFEKNSTLTTISEYALYSVKTYGDTIVPKSVTSIGEKALTDSINTTTYKIWMERGDKTNMTLGSSWSGKRTVVWGSNWKYDSDGNPYIIS